jgi:hypothetical protein
MRRPSKEINNPVDARGQLDTWDNNKKATPATNPINTRHRAITFATSLLKRFYYFQDRDGESFSPDAVPLDSEAPNRRNIANQTLRVWLTKIAPPTAMPAKLKI